MAVSTLCRVLDETNEYRKIVYRDNMYFFLFRKKKQKVRLYFSSKRELYC